MYVELFVPNRYILVQPGGVSPVLRRTVDLELLSVGDVVGHLTGNPNEWSLVLLYHLSRTAQEHIAIRQQKTLVLTECVGRHSD